MPSRRSGVLGGALLLLPALLPLAGADLKDTDDGGAQIDAYDSRAAGHEGAPTSGSGSGDRWVRHPLCREWITVELTGQMFPGVWEGAVPDCVTELPAPAGQCPDAEVALAPWWVSRDQGGGAYGPWTQVSGYQCTTDLIYAQVVNAWATMPIAPNTYDVQPAGGYAIAELGVNLVVDTDPRTMNVTLIGTPVIIRAVATQYTWTNTDGTTWTSTTPGRPYDQGGAPFTFPRRPEHRTTFTLTTTWRGEFSTNAGGTWRDAPGTATTTSISTTVHVYNPHTHRVDCDLDGNCVNGTQGAGNHKTIFDPDGDGIDNYLIPDNRIDAYLTARDNNATWTDTARKNVG